MDKVFTTKSDYIFQELKKRILNGEIKPGENINISKVSKAYGMSIIPVREAIKRLESEGLVKIIPHKGAQVITYNANEAREVIVVRAILEGFAASSAIENISDEVINKLETLNNEMNEMAKEGNDEKFVELNIEFHRLIYKQSPYKMLYDMIVGLWEDSAWSKSIFARHNKKMIESVKEHEEILEAIKQKKSNLTEKLVRRHKIKSVEYYTESKK